MIIPSCEEIIKISSQYDMIPICREVYADVVTPITLLRRLARQSKRFYLLESIEGGEKWGRYSFLGYNPVLRVTCRNGKAAIESQVREIPSQEIVTDNPLQVLREILSLYKSPRLKGQPPFTGGFVGYFSYAMIEYGEPTLKISRGDGNDYDLMLFDKVIAYDHLKQKIAIVVNMRTGRNAARMGLTDTEIKKRTRAGEESRAPLQRTWPEASDSGAVMRCEMEAADKAPLQQSGAGTEDKKPLQQTKENAAYTGLVKLWQEVQKVETEEDPIAGQDEKPQETQNLEFLMKEYGRACGDIETIAALLNETRPLETLTSSERPLFTCNVTKDEYCRMVEKTKEYILEGDIFQAVISRQFSSPYKGSLLNAYRVLRTTNPSPYMVYMNIDGDEIISASPETLVRLKDGRLTTFPVAGSRPRGKTEKDDRRLELELMSDEKELAEHNMLVDLGRNDIGRISSFGSVEVTEYQMIHKYSKIMHICSQVEGDIGDDYDACSAVEALLPAGTLSGAPKIRACEIIEELEGTPRGIYGGALGYLDFTGNLDTCIAIRMAVKQKGRVTVQAGGGIVADSVPELEYQESANKAKAVINAIINAGEVDDK